VQKGVNSRTTLLVCGEGGGRKRADAEILGVRALAEDEFFKWLDGLMAAGPAADQVI
jgi:BRCT domain type II-containing protein